MTAGWARLPRATAHIAQVAAAFGTEDGSVMKAFTEGGIVKLQLTRRVQTGWRTASGGKRVCSRWNGLLSDSTGRRSGRHRSQRYGRQVSERRSRGDLAFVLDGQVGQAAGGVNGAIGEDAASRAGIHAARAGAAAVSGKRGGLVRWGCRGRVQPTGRYEPISGLMRHLCIFANPAQTGTLGQIFFEDGGRIGEPAPLEGIGPFDG